MKDQSPNEEKMNDLGTDHGRKLMPRKAPKGNLKDKQVYNLAYDMGRSERKALKEHEHPYWEKK